MVQTLLTNVNTNVAKTESDLAYTFRQDKIPASKHNPVGLEELSTKVISSLGYIKRRDKY